MLFVRRQINIVLAAGMTFVILTGGIDLAVEIEVLGFTAVVAVVVSLIPGLSLVAVPAALLAGLFGRSAHRNDGRLRWIAPVHRYARHLYGDPRCRLPLAAGGTTVINSKIGFAGLGMGTSDRFRGLSLSLF